MVNLRKELEKIKEKQDKLNYLQKLYKETKDKELKLEILEILEDLLQDETLEEVLEPVRVRHEVLEDIQREVPIINPTPMIHSQPIQNISFTRRAADDDEDEMISYERAGKSNQLYTPSQLESGVPSDNNFRRSDRAPAGLLYSSQQDRPSLGESASDNNRNTGESVDEYVRAPQTQIETSKDINPFRIDNIIKGEEDKRYIKNRKKEEIKW